MINPTCIEATAPPDNSVNFVAFIYKKFCEVWAILAGDSCNKGFFQLGTKLNEIQIWIRKLIQNKNLKME